MNYYRAFRDIKEAIPRDAIIVQRGRQHDGHRAHAAQQLRAAHTASTPAATARWASGSASPSPPPSCRRTARSCRCRATRAFGFSGMELETICRYSLPITTIVLNNGGIGGGFEDWPADQPLPPSACRAPPATRRSARPSAARASTSRTPPICGPTLDKAIVVGPPVGRARADRRPGRPQAPGVLLEDVIAAPCWSRATAPGSRGWRRRRCCRSATPRRGACAGPAPTAGR